ncbi:unnamed protein product [Lactuca saligna]|uniref:SWIM-type domain-containing protein n=1 Tax=Lactuca saligna TaxID=75948 RepID=A0AA36EI21_LACSI|nr:unnamed protein product [Lactuca saligna]
MSCYSKYLTGVEFKSFGVNIISELDVIEYWNDFPDGHKDNAIVEFVDTIDALQQKYIKDIAEKIRASTGNNTVVEQLFWNTCKVYNMSDFYACLNNLQNEVNANDLDWLDKIPIAKWVRHDLPITTIIQMVHDSMQGVYVQRATFGVHFTWDFHGLLILYTLKLDRGICTCGKWQKYGVPCDHVVASLQRLEFEEIQQMVNLKLTNAVYRHGFQTETVNPIKILMHWEIPVESVVILPPKQFSEIVMYGSQ